MGIRDTRKEPLTICLEIVTGVSCEARDTCTMQKIIEVVIDYSPSTLMFRTLFLGSCPILLYVPHKLLPGEIGQTRLWCSFHNHHQRAGLPSDAVPQCIQELVSLGCFVAARQSIAAVQKGALSF